MDRIIIHEVGRMECLSQGFIEAVARVLDRPVPVLATVAAKGGEFIAAVKRRPDVELVRITLVLLPKILAASTA